MSSPMRQLAAPLPWKGGKVRVASRVWDLLGPVDHYVELCAGMANVLLQRPPAHFGGARLPVETINDLDCYVVNFWRACAWRMDELRAAGEWPVSELDNAARLRELAERNGDTRARLLADPRWCDPELAAWWALAHSQAIGSRLVPSLPNLSNGGGGWQSLRQRNRAGQGQTGRAWGTYLEDLERRLAHVRIVCGDYRRLLRRTVLLMCRGMVRRVGLFVDPPYGVDRYAEEVGADPEAEPFSRAVLAAELRALVDELGDAVTIVLAGFAGDYSEEEDLPGWSSETWDGSAAHYHGKGRPQEVLWYVNPYRSPVAEASQAGLWGVAGPLQ